MKWIKFRDQIPKTKDPFKCSDDMLLWFPQIPSFEIGFWNPIGMEWCDGESMTGCPIKPEYWSELKPFPRHDMGEWYDYWNLEPVHDDKKLIWEERNPDHINLATFKIDKWYFVDMWGESEIKIVDEPGKLMWRDIPPLPKE